MNTKELYVFVNQKLKTDSVWTKEQAELYSTLKLLLHEHSLSKKFYKVNKNHAEFLNFMFEKDWYKEDKDKIYIKNIIKVCVVLENPINNSEGIKILLYFKGFDVYLTGFYDKKIEVFYIYFSKKLSESSEPAYLAYYNTHSNIKEQHSMRLPQFEKIYEVTGFLDTMIKKASLIRMVVDILRFHKCESLMHHNVGLNYNVTLEQIYSKIRA